MILCQTPLCDDPTHGPGDCAKAHDRCPMCGRPWSKHASPCPNAVGWFDTMSARVTVKTPARSPKMSVEELERELVRLRRQHEASQAETWKWSDKVEAMENRLKRRKTRRNDNG